MGQLTPPPLRSSPWSQLQPPTMAVVAHVWGLYHIKSYHFESFKIENRGSEPKVRDPGSPLLIIIGTCHVHEVSLSLLCHWYFMAMPLLCHRCAMPISKPCPSKVMAMPSLCQCYVTAMLRHGHSCSRRQWRLWLMCGDCTT